MFPKAKRLSREHFKGLAKGRRVHSEHFSLSIPREGSGYAVVVPKKLEKRAVGRHLLKRRVLSALKSYESLPSALVIFPKQEAFSLTYRQIKEELDTLLTRISG